MNCSTSRLLACFLSLMALNGAWAQSTLNGPSSGESAGAKMVPQGVLTAKDTQEPTDPNRFFKSDEWFFSWGYNKTHYSKSNINVVQPSLGNNYTVNAVQGHDEFSHVVCCSPDNLRWGRYLDESKVFALDLSLDHTKYTTTVGQVALITGKHSTGVGNQLLSADYFSYMLHNGLNHLMVDLVYRRPITAAAVSDTSSLAFIGKVGAGVAYIHPYININGASSDVGSKSLNNLIGFNSGWWRIVGVSTSVEAGFRYVLSKPWYLELTDKTIFTTMSNIPVSNGTASQNLWSNEILLSVGYTFDNK